MHILCLQRSSVNKDLELRQSTFRKCISSELFQLSLVVQLSIQSGIISVIGTFLEPVLGKWIWFCANGLRSLLLRCCLWINSVSVRFWDRHRYYITGSSGKESNTKIRMTFFYKCTHTTRTARCQHLRSYSSGFKLYRSPIPCWKTNMLWSIRGNTSRSSSAPVANQTEGKSPTSFWRSHVSSQGILERGVSTYSIRWDLILLSSWRENGTHLAGEGSLRGDFRTHWIWRAFWLQEEGWSVFIADGSRSMEDIEFSLTIQFFFTCKVERAAYV